MVSAAAHKGIEMIRDKLECIWRILTSGHIYLITQKHPGESPYLSASGVGDVKDMLLMARAMQQSYLHFISAIEHIATEKGELHLLKELRDAIDAVEGTDGGNG